MKEAGQREADKRPAKASYDLKMREKRHGGRTETGGGVRMKRSLMRKAVEGKSLTLPKGVHDGFLPVIKKKEKQFHDAALTHSILSFRTSGSAPVGDIDT